MNAPRAARHSFLSYLDELTSLLDRHGALARSALALDAQHEAALLAQEAYAEALLAHAEGFAQLEADARLLPRPDGAADGHARFVQALAECSRVCIDAVAALDAGAPARSVLYGFLPAALLLQEATDGIVLVGRSLAPARA